VAVSFPFPVQIPHILNPSHATFLLAYVDGIECSETVAFKLQTPVNNPEESTQHSEQGKSLKSRIVKYCSAELYVQNTKNY
jgi:hypothetical protein